MCLSQEWFDMRWRRMDRLSYKPGHVDLETFMRACAFTWADLVAAGLLRPKAAKSTAELLDHEPTPIGSKFLHREVAFDILMVRKGKGLALVDAVLAATKPRTGR